MIYQIEMIIQAPRDWVASLYIDHNGMKAWETGLESIESHTGQLFDEGSQGDLIFRFGDSEMRMHVHVESSHLPDDITLIYQVPGAWNRCVNYFKHHDEGTLWIMDVEFRFDNPVDIPLERFIEKTTQGMTLYKNFCEMRHSG
jgi:hypothetical protein